MMKLVLRPWLGLAAALSTLPGVALGQTPPQPVDPAPVVPPAERAPVQPLPEPAPAADAPTMAPITPEPPVVTTPMPVEAPAEEEAPAPATTISGHIEAAYHINFSDTAGTNAVVLGQDGEPIPGAYPLHPYYDPHGHSFVLHAAHLAFAHSFNENVSAVIEIDAGYDASLTAAAPFAGSLFDVQEAYATYKSGVFSMTAGKFVTYEGIEVIEGPLNPTISRGFLYGLAEPFTHTGVKFHFTGDTVDFGIGVVNGWDNLIDNNGMKTIIFKLGLTPGESFLANFSGTFGAEGDSNDEHRLSLDLTGAWTASETFALWYQVNFGMDYIGGDETVSWFGAGLQPVYTGETFTFGGRVEIFSDPDGVRTGLGPDGTYVNVTLTPGFILAEGFKVRLEVRADIATEEYLGKISDLSKAQFSGAVGAEYVF